MTTTTYRFSPLFFKNTVQGRIFIHPRNLTQDLDRSIVHEIEEKVGGNCSKDGYVRENSVSLLKRSIGMASGETTDGYVAFNVLYSVDVCNPKNGDILPCVVKLQNKVGFEVEPILDDKQNPLIILVMKEHAEDKTLLNTIQKGDRVAVKVVGGKFDLGDDRIKVIGIIMGRIQ